MDLAIGSFMSQDISKKEQKLMQELISMSASAAKHKVGLKLLWDHLKTLDTIGSYNTPYKYSAFSLV